MLMIAHRAGTDRYPEQCMDAVNFSLNNGADLAEVDARFTLDKDTPVICHDENVARVFGVDSNVSDLTLDEFLALRQVENPEIGTYTFKQLLENTTGRILLHVKIKPEEFAPILRVIHECKAEERVVLGVQETECVDCIKKDDPRIQILSFMYNLGYLDAFLDTSCEYIRLWEPWTTQERIDKVHAAGKKVWIMSGTFDTVGYTEWSNLKKWQSMGADGVLINEILKAKAYMEE